MKTYTFHVSLLDYGPLWRKIEMRADQSLADLHSIILDSIDWEVRRPYSFFMSGQAWDDESEYCLPADAIPEDWFFDDEIEGLAAEAFDDETGELTADDFAGSTKPARQIEPSSPLNLEDLPIEDEEFGPDIDAETAEALRAAMGDGPLPQSMEEMFTLVEQNAELRAQLAQVLAEATGLPVFMADLVLSNANSFLGMLPDDALPGMFDLELAEPLGDVRSTTIETLNLQPEQSFLFLFDYDEEWQFTVRVEAVAEDAGEDAEYPRIIEGEGDAPSQFSEWVFEA